MMVVRFSPALRVMGQYTIRHLFFLRRIDLYHAAAILSPRGTKKLCFCTSSLALNERLDVQNLLFEHCVIKVY